MCRSQRCLLSLHYSYNVIVLLHTCYFLLVWQYQKYSDYKQLARQLVIIFDYQILDCSVIHLLACIFTPGKAASDMLTGSLDTSQLTYTLQLYKELHNVYLKTEPKFTELARKFGTVADWETICPYLIDDDTGQRTREIAKNHMDVAGRRDEMLRLFLMKSNPTWRDVVEALRAGRYDNLADEIEKELQG